MPLQSLPFPAVQPLELVKLEGLPVEDITDIYSSEYGLLCDTGCILFCRFQDVLSGYSLWHQSLHPRLSLLLPGMEGELLQGAEGRIYYCVKTSLARYSFYEVVGKDSFQLVKLEGLPVEDITAGVFCFAVFKTFYHGTASGISLCIPGSLFSCNII